MSRMSLGREERLLKQPVIEMHDKELQEITEQAGDYQPSDLFLKKMEHLFQKDERRIRRKGMRQKIVAASASAAAVFVLLLAFNADVRAFVLPFLKHQDEQTKMMDYIHQEREETTGKHGKIIGFEMTYIPDGFVYNKEMSWVETENFGTLSYQNKDEILLSFNYSEGGNPSVNDEFTDNSTVALKNGIVCDSYRSHTKGHGSTLVWYQEDMICTLGIDNQEGWEYEELLKVANGIRTVYQDGTKE